MTNWSNSQSMLYRIVYLSMAAKPFQEGDIVALADDASRRNAVSDVTGLLLYDGGRFIQALEGSKAAVIKTMDRIELDRRHSAISFLYDGVADERQFGTWSMKYRRGPDGCCTGEFIEKVKSNLAMAEAPHLQAAFIGFAVLGSHRPRGYVCRER